jgi:hypothetical protein
MFATNYEPIIVLAEGCDYDLLDGKRYTFQQVFNMTGAERAALGLARIQLQSPASDRYDAIGKTVELVDGVPTERIELVEMTVEDRRQRLLDRIGEIRWQIETGGMLFGMWRFATDRVSQARIHHYRRRAQDDADFSTRWKIEAGTFEVMNSTVMIALADALDHHVDACFANEARLAEMITAANTHADIDAITIGGWPE